MVATSALSLYRVVTVKHGVKTFVAVDGGMADNLEPMVYGQRFEATITNRVGGGELCDLVGRHCESGDRRLLLLRLQQPQRSPPSTGGPAQGRALVVTPADPHGRFQASTWGSAGLR
jgi:hypothetical protein